MYKSGLVVLVYLAGNNTPLLLAPIFLNQSDYLLEAVAIIAKNKQLSQYDCSKEEVQRNQIYSP